MIATHLTHRALPLLLTMSVTACTGTSVGNPEDGDVTVRTELHEGDTTKREGAAGTQTRGQPLSAPGGVTLTEVRVHLASVLLRKEGCGKENEREGATEQAVSLVADSEAQQQTFGLDMSSGAYCQVRVQLGPGQDGATLSIKGTRADGAAFTITSELERLLLFTRGDQQSFTIKPGEDTLFMLGFDVSTWIDAAELDGLDADALTINERTQPQVIAKLNQRVAASLSLNQDTNRDMITNDELIVAQPGN